MDSVPLLASEVIAFAKAKWRAVQGIELVRSVASQVKQERGSKTLTDQGLIPEASMKSRMLNVLR